MSERYRITIHSGNDSFTFKTKTRVGEFWNFAEEMKEHKAGVIPACTRCKWLKVEKL